LSYGRVVVSLLLETLRFQYFHPGKTFVFPTSFLRLRARLA